MPGSRATSLGVGKARVKVTDKAEGLAPHVGYTSAIGGQRWSTINDAVSCSFGPRQR